MKTVEIPCAGCGAAVPILESLSALAPPSLRCTTCQHPPQPAADQPPTRSQAWLRNHVPADCRTASLELVQGKMRQVLRRVVASWPEPVLTREGRPVTAFPIGGPAGVGKSCAVYGTLIELVKTGKVLPAEIVAGTEEDLLVPASRITSYVTRDSGSPWRRVIPVGTKVVFIDDVGYGAYGSDAARLAATKALMDRVGQLGAVLFLTTNIPSGKFAEALGAAAASRLSAMSALPADVGYLQVGTVDRRTGVDHATARPSGVVA